MSRRLTMGIPSFPVEPPQIGLFNGDQPAVVERANPDQTPAPPVTGAPEEPEIDAAEKPEPTAPVVTDGLLQAGVEVTEIPRRRRRTATIEQQPRKIDQLSGILVTAKMVAYILLLVVEIGLSGLAMWSLESTFLVQVGLAIVGVVASVAGVYLFLTGLSSFGWARVFYLAAWGLYAALFVLLIWSWKVGGAQGEIEKNTAQIASITAVSAQLTANQAQASALRERLAAVNQWNNEARADYRAELQRLAIEADRLTNLLQPQSTGPEQHSTGLSTFRRMGELFGQSAAAAADWWWLGALTLLQFFSVILAPRIKSRPSA